MDTMKKIDEYFDTVSDKKLLHDLTEAGFKILPAGGMKMRNVIVLLTNVLILDQMNTKIHVIALDNGETLLSGWHEWTMTYKMGIENRWIERIENDLPNVQVVNVIACEDGERVFTWSR